MDKLRQPFPTTSTLYDELSTTAEALMEKMLSFCVEHNNTIDALSAAGTGGSSEAAAVESEDSQPLVSAKFHVHIDLNHISAHLGEQLLARGYTVSDFLSYEGKSASPRAIRTLRLTDIKTYKAELKRVTEECKKDGEFVGFVEGEVVADRRAVDEKPYNPGIKIPFRASSFREPGGNSKTADMHVGLCPVKSSPELMIQLLNMGFSLVLAPKEDGLLAIFSLQGTSKTIKKLFDSTYQFLTSAGGAVNCTLKDERISWLWVSGLDAPSTRVISKIDFT